MKMNSECLDCFRRSNTRLLEKYGLNRDQTRKFEQFFDELAEGHPRLSGPEMQRELHYFLRSMTGDRDPYRREKIESNRRAIELYAEWKPRVEAHPDPLDLAMRLAIAGNIMDYAANSEFDLDATIEKVFSAALPAFHTRLFRERLEEAGRILYLGDNAGEVVFDRLFLETLDHPDVIFAVRGGPAINDITMEDAKETGVDRIARVISTGVDIASVLPHISSAEFNLEFSRADLVISKGQGNLEGLIDRKDSRIFFLFMVKCAVVAERVGLEEGSVAVYNSGIPSR